VFHLLIFYFQIGSRHRLCVVKNRLLAAVKQVALPPAILSRLTPRLRSVAEFISTQKGHELICDTRTVTSERSAGSIGEVRRSITP
jgi:hypothetical protein